TAQFMEQKVIDWHVQKVGRGGTPYSKTMRNPIAQVKKLVWLLSDDLKKKNGRAWVQGVVVFSNQDSSVRVRHSGNVPVLNLSELNRYILSYQAKSRIVNHCSVESTLKDLKAA
ncbi:nuclease-related domain-containing protein, partial [Oleiphilus sp. HI0123]|uniref:nuclease-related domain-containing protein n=1 Tax=Oleiphilus sp. HI0123 TaxID=1822265 RepID=UPI000A7E08B8